MIRAFISYICQGLLSSLRSFKGTSYFSAWWRQGDGGCDSSAGRQAEISYLVNHGCLLFLRGCSFPHQRGGEKQRDHLSGATSAINLRLLTQSQPLSFTPPPPSPSFSSPHPVWQQPSIPACKSGGRQTRAGVNTPSAPSVGLLIHEQPQHFPYVDWIMLILPICLHKADFKK